MNSAAFAPAAENAVETASVATNMRLILLGFTPKFIMVSSQSNHLDGGYHGEAVPVRQSVCDAILAKVVRLWF
jgi:hypothetical protein